MALVLGTNSGFVTTSPTADPGGSNIPIDNNSTVTKDTSPAGATTISEMGWWCDTATEESNFEVGLYAADGTVVPGEAGTRLYVSATNAKGTTAGWKTVAVNWAISENTAYWLAVQVDNTATTTNIDTSNTGGVGSDTRTAQTTLNNPYGGGTIASATGMKTIYALIPSAGTNMKINIGDVWKAVPAAKINIGDVWKNVAAAKINIGDVWKTVF